MNEYYRLAHTSQAIAHRQADNPTVKKLWRSFTLGDADVVISTCDDWIFRIGDTALPVCESNNEYALSVTQTGIAIVGKDYGSLMRGLVELLMKMERQGDDTVIACGEWKSHFSVQNRMLHICVFPEHDLHFIKKLIRLSALCQYTHIVIEFWGMLQYDCMKELAWPCAFSKGEARELIDECRDLGLEPIPMFNQLGHATASRLKYGKHVVLDQNPRLEHLFTPDGWAWNICSDEVRDLLKSVRHELYELFGEGRYVHLGCDEAYYYTRNNTMRREHMTRYLSELTADAVAEGRKPMVWMDMMLASGIYPDCTANCKPEDVALLQSSLHPDTVMVDWQYRCTAVPIPTAISLKDSGHDVIGAPWAKPSNYQAWVKTIVQNDLSGIMLTTWDTLKDEMHSILGCARACGSAEFPWSQYSGLREETATLLRRVSFEGNTYADCGWAKEQLYV